MLELNKKTEKVLTRIGKALVNQQKAKIIIPAKDSFSGFWFGGGNITRGNDGNLYVTGRYRNYGDSRTGLASGERGKEFAIFVSRDNGNSWDKIVSRQKEELSYGSYEVVSIEGTALKHTDDGVELFISTEKMGIEYPDGLKPYKKPGAGVWTIDSIKASSVSDLASAEVFPFLASNDSRFLHVKDPFLYTSNQGDEYVLFCTHPFSWSSSNTGYICRKHGAENFDEPVWDFFPRGFTWDVAIARGTSLVQLPREGVLKDCDPVSLFFYDGGESLRDLDEHKAAVKRPRGYSCEEIGGLAYIQNDNLDDVKRLSVDLPLFMSPYGSASSRYVDVLVDDTGYYVIWQQSQPDFSQPFVMNFTAKEEIIKILSDVTYGEKYDE
ncbi:MAG: exo-alpha-sialidase [Spirochaetia bacterium]|nr:exo-alpha-sialidase [Spirochaetia bacterium]